jgi:hypothetical protein
MLKGEFVSFQKRDNRMAFPEQKDLSAFNTVVLGLGLIPSLSVYLFQPINVKSIDQGMGHNFGLGDTNLMLSFGFKWDEGLRLIPQKESLDELIDWHFMVWSACSFPTGPTEKNDDQGARFAPDMQTGFGKPSPAVGMAALKQLSPNLTGLAEVNYQVFFPHSYSYTRYRFGAETRINTAVSYRFYGKGRIRADLVGELIGLNLQRDRERNDQGKMESLQASGGNILYASMGIRLSLGTITLALGGKRAALKSLNEASEQQGSEGLENIRLSLSLSTSAAVF